MSVRVYVSELPLTSNRADLGKLFAKIAPVEEIYVPASTPTGLKRNFAIVKIVGDAVIAQKCVRAFNNCHWKGARIRVELAKMHYQEKLQQEKMAEKDQPRKTYPRIEEAFEIKPANTEHMVLRLRNRMSNHVFVSTTPTSNPDILSSCRPIKFDDKGHMIQKGASKATHPLSIESAQYESNAFASSQSGDQFSGSDTEESSSESSDSGDSSSDDVAVTTRPNTVGKTKAVETPSGSGATSGRRVGFGAIASLPPRVLPGPFTATSTLSQPACNTCVEDVSFNGTLLMNGKSDGNSGVVGRFGRGGAGDSQDEEARIITENGCYDELSDDGDDVACVAPSELDAQALEAERVRQKSIMLALLQHRPALIGPDGESLSGSNAPTTTAILNDTNAGMVEQQSLVSTAVKSETGRGGDIRSTSAAAWGAPRFDPLSTVTAAGTDMAALRLSADEVKIRAARESEAVALASRKEVVSRESKSAWERYEGGGGFQEGQMDDKHAKEDEGDKRFADLPKLKGIFHREGGLTWGEDGTLTSSAAIREGTNDQDLALDALYLEAEKFAIDVREDSAVKEAGGTGGGMMFGFFENTEPVISPSAEEGGASGSVESNLASVDCSKGQDGEHNTLSAVCGVEDDTEARDRFVFPSLQSVILNAFAFQRDANEESIIESWKTTKEKLVIDYKRKSKEARKKSENWRRSSNIRPGIINGDANTIDSGFTDKPKRKIHSSRGGKNSKRRRAN